MLFVLREDRDEGHGSRARERPSPRCGSSSHCQRRRKVIHDAAVRSEIELVRSHSIAQREGTGDGLGTRNIQRGNVVKAARGSGENSRETRRCEGWSGDCSDQITRRIQNVYDAPSFVAHRSDELTVRYGCGEGRGRHDAIGYARERCGCSEHSSGACDLDEVSARLQSECGSVEIRSCVRYDGSGVSDGDRARSRLH